MEDLSGRILDFPARAAAVSTFLHSLRFRHLADLAALEASINDRRLSDELVEVWVARNWVRRAPSSPMHVFAGDELPEDLTLGEFCGEPPDGSREPAVFPDESA